MYVIQNKIGIMISVDRSVKDLMIEVFIRKVICGVLVHVIFSDKAYKIGKYLDIK